MTVKIFNDGDTPFLDWMIANPDGFVLNTERIKTSKKTFLHLSNCTHIAVTGKGYRPDPFTRYDHIKVCSNDKRELLGWIIKNRPKANGFSDLCKSCDP